ncbi:MAG: pyridoxamine 5'-phosphate oxidase family protein [Hyphomicrobiaceae bacterium]|nr:pyridoxamine 5'-phosphate oxidase family protein [Hyphomicrobiaceae bacterium]
MNRTPTTMLAPTAAPAAARDVMALISGANKAALSTLDASTGHPYGSLVTVATDGEGRPLMLLSRLARHTRNLDADARASLLFEPLGLTAGDPLAVARVTAIGRAMRIDPADAAAIGDVRTRFLSRHPDAAGYAGFADFGWFRLEIATAHFIGGFGRIIDVTAADLRAAFKLA